MQSPGSALAHWHEFYMLLGTAAGTLVGLLFVAASIASGVFSSDRSAPLRVFLSATVVHFASVLLLSLIVLAPIENWTLLGVTVLACGLAGVAYYGGRETGCIVLAISLTSLLVVGIHNAWDITVWSMTRRRE